MKILRLTHIYICILCVGLFLTSCGKNYYDVIPQSSPAVASVDLRQIATDAGIAPSDVAGILPFYKGIDLESPAYAFISPGNYYGLVLAVDDKAEIAKAVSGSNDFVFDKESGGLCWALWDTRWQMAWNGDALMILGPVVPTERDFMRRTVSAMFNASDGINSSPLFERLQAMKGSVSVVARLTALPEILGDIVSLPVCVPKDSLLLCSEVALGDGKITVDNKIEVLGNADGGGCSGLKPYGGSVKAGVLPESMGAMYLGLDGAEMLARIKGDRQLRTFLTAMGADFNVEKLIGNIYGDAVVTLRGFDAQGSPRLELAAQVKDAEVPIAVGRSACCVPGARLREAKDAGYIYSADGRMLNFDVRDGNFQCAMGCALPGKAESAARVADVPAAAKGKICYISLNGSELAEIPILSQLLGGKVADFLGKYPVISYSSADARCSRLEFCGK